MTSLTKTPPLSLPRFANVAMQIPARKGRPLTRRELERGAGSSIAEAIAAGCLWEEEAEIPLGDYRAIVFDAALGRDRALIVHLWSFPHHPVLIEVTWSSKRASRWPGPDVARRMERLGFHSQGGGDRHEREVSVVSRRDVVRTARLVLDILHDVFGYRGTVAIYIQAVSSGRAAREFVYNSFSAEEIAWIAERLGCRTRIQPEDTDGSKTTIALRKGSAVAEIVLADLVEPHQYASGFLGSPAVPPFARRGARTAGRRDRSAKNPDAWRVGVTLSFEGGVTAEWVAERIEYGMALVAGRTPRPGPLLSLTGTSRPPRQLPHLYSSEEYAEATSSTVPEAEEEVLRELRALRARARARR